MYIKKDCQTCGGDGFIIVAIGVPECCGNFIEPFVCCNNPIEGFIPSQERCPECEAEEEIINEQINK